MLVDIGEKVHIMERRLFDGDVRRHFFGVVDRVEPTAIRARGYLFTYDSASSQYVRSESPRTRIFPLDANGFIINIAPIQTEPADVRYREAANGRLVVTDGGEFSLDINEFARMR